MSLKKTNPEQIERLQQRSTRSISVAKDLSRGLVVHQRFGFAAKHLDRTYTKLLFEIPFKCVIVCNLSKPAFFQLAGIKSFFRESYRVRKRERESKGEREAQLSGIRSWDQS